MDKPQNYYEMIQSGEAQGLTHSMPTLELSQGEMAEQARQSKMVTLGFDRYESITPIGDLDPDMQLTDDGRADVAEAIRAVKDWVLGKRPWLSLVGPTGTGKTVMLKAAVWRLLEMEKRPYYITSSQFDREIKRFDAEQDPDDWVEKLGRDPEFLVVDDLGSGLKVTDYNTSRLERVFDIRYRLALPTAVAANLLPLDLERSVGARVYSRLRDARLGRFVPIRGADMRPELAVEGDAD
jgi:DNA replication protein DnaC